MVKATGFHMADCVIQVSDPAAGKTLGKHVCTCPLKGRRSGERGLWHDHSPGDAFSLFLSLSVSLQPFAREQIKKIKMRIG